ncbi:MAG: amino acid permease [Woeseiaceae bacterium]|nr:amino acid permease [Woeseiaceae bacterium]
MTSSPAPKRQLVRALTLVPAAAVILANIIGTGVFVKARVMTCNVGSPGMVLTVWFVAGLLTLAGALVYAELGAMMPRSGGEFHFIGAAFGRRWAFLYGWTKTVALGASVAAAAIIMVVFLNDLTGGALPSLALKVLPFLIIAITTGINFASVRSSGLTATVLTAVKVALVLLVGLGAFLLADGSWGNFAMDGSAGACEGVPDSAKLGLKGFGAAMLGALWGYNGWAVIASLGGEVNNPGRTLPRALIGGTLIVIALYLLINAAYFYVLTPLEVASVAESSSVASEAASRFFGPGVAALMAAGLMLSAYGTLHTTLLTGARVPFALARAGLFPAGFAWISVSGVPVVAVLVIGVWSVFLAATGTFDILTDVYIFVLSIFFGMNSAALFILRRRSPNANRPYRVWGYPFVPALFLLVTVYLLINTLLATPLRAIGGIGLIIVGLPLYGYFDRRCVELEPLDWPQRDQ